jgi:hypothetical protein
MTTKSAAARPGAPESVATWRATPPRAVGIEEQPAVIGVVEEDALGEAGGQRRGGRDERESPALR